MSTGLVVAAVAVLVALVGGGSLALRNGRFAGSHAVRGASADQRRADPGSGSEAPDLLAGTAWASQRGERATLLQFSSAFCAPCRTTRRVLGDVATAVPGLSHVEVDAEQHLDLVRRLGVLRTPTTIVLDERGREVSRASGAPTRAQVLAAVASAIGETPE